MHEPPLEAAPGEEHRVDARVVVAAGILVDLRRAAELARHPEERGIEQAAAFEIGHQSMDRVVEWRHKVVAGHLHVAVAVPRAVVDRHEPRARFDEPPGHDQLFGQPLRLVLAVWPKLPAGRLAAVEVEYLVALPLERERLLGIARCDQFVGLGMEAVHGVERGGIGLERPDPLLDELAGLLTAVEPVERQPLRQREVANLEALPLGGIVAEFERAVGARQKPDVAREGILLRDGDGGRQESAAAELVRDDRPHRRVVDHRSRDITGGEVVGGDPVVWNLAHDSADDRELVSDLGRLRKVVAEDLARLCLHHAEGPPILDGCLRLGVERLVLREATTEVQLDHALDPLGKLSLRGLG